mgnify:CR=1 FL=1
MTQFKGEIFSTSLLVRFPIYFTAKNLPGQEESVRCHLSDILVWWHMSNLIEKRVLKSTERKFKSGVIETLAVILWSMKNKFFFLFLVYKFK